MADRNLTLTAWTLATFDVSLFVLIAVIVGHVSGALGDLLAGLNTVVGVIIFLYLWALFTFATRWVLGEAPLAESSISLIFLRSIAAGGVAGVVFLLSIVLIAVIPSAVSRSIQAVSVALIAIIGATVAAVIGSVVGLVAGLLNMAVYRVAGYVLPATLNS